jgi:hypothetical protein
MAVTDRYGRILWQRSQAARVATVGELFDGGSRVVRHVGMIARSGAVGEPLEVFVFARASLFALAPQPDEFVPCLAYVMPLAPRGRVHGYVTCLCPTPGSQRLAPGPLAPLEEAELYPTIV